MADETKVYLIVIAVTFSVTIASFIVMIINDLRFHRQDEQRFTALDKSADGLNTRHDRAVVEHDRLSTEHGRLSAEHGRLTTEHDRLSTEHDRLSTEHDRLSAEHDRIKEKIDKIYLNQEIDKAGREAAGKFIPEEKKMMDMVNQIYMNHTKLIQENVELKQENEKLRAEITQLRNQDAENAQNLNFDDVELPEMEIDDEEWER